MRVIALAAVALIWCSLASADVRVISRPAGPHVDVRVVDGSAWNVRPGRPAGSGSINPDGAHLGDGYPGSHATHERVVLAWIRHATSELVVTSVDATGQEEGRFAVAADNPEGVPVIHQRLDDYIVFWQELAPTPRVVASIYRRGLGLGEVVTLQDGVLIESVEVAGKITTMSSTRDGSSLLISIFPSLRTRPFPIPEESIQVFMLSPVRASSMSQDEPPIVPCVRTKDEEIVVAWPTTDGWHDKVTIARGEIDGPVAVRGRNCSSVVNSQRD